MLEFLKVNLNLWFLILKVALVIIHFLSAETLEILQRNESEFDMLSSEFWPESPQGIFELSVEKIWNAWF